MKTKETSTRKQAILWWDSLPVWGNPSKEYYMGLYYSDDNVTPERIEEIWRKETQTICDESPREFLKNNPKPDQKKYSQEEVDELLDRQAAESTHQAFKAMKAINAKQFKQFNESLFKSYIDKFSDEDKLKALIVVWSKISYSQRKNFLIDFT